MWKNLIFNRKVWWTLLKNCMYKKCLKSSFAPTCWSLHLLLFFAVYENKRKFIFPFLFKIMTWQYIDKYLHMWILITSLCNGNLFIECIYVTYVPRYQQNEKAMTQRSSFALRDFAGDVKISRTTSYVKTFTEFQSVSNQSSSIINLSKP